MPTALRHDPFSAFEFALRESDWVLADLLASRLAGSDPSRLRLEHELDVGRGLPGRPRSLDELRCLATLTRSLNLDRGGD